MNTWPSTWPAGIIPPPRIHRHRYAGVLAPNSSLRRRVVASAGPPAVLAQWLAEAAQKMHIENNRGQDQKDEGTPDPNLRDPEPTFPSRASRPAWAMLLARIYEILPLLCPRCSSPLQAISFITQPEVIARILTHLDEPVAPPIVTPARQLPPHLFCAPRNRAPPGLITETAVPDFDR